MFLTNHNKITVKLVNSQYAYSYNVYIGRKLIKSTGKFIKPYLKRLFTVIITDKNVAKYHLINLQTSLSIFKIQFKTIILSPGEKNKCVLVFEKLLEKLIEYGVERNDTIIAFGGGVIGDLVGFAASVLRRGINFIQIPTSILAQVDSSIGGKTGINSLQGKNLIGSFYHPKIVISDIDVLDTLSDRHIRAGYAEILKYALINNFNFFTWLNKNGMKLISGDKKLRQYAIIESCKSKINIINQDEKEYGIRSLLNLGHTFGHAFENYTKYSDCLIHGESVAIGMVLAFEFSNFLGLNSENEINLLKKHLFDIGLPNSLYFKGLNPLPTAQEMLKLMLQDKKVEQGNLTFILMNGIGKAFIKKNINKKLILKFLIGKKFSKGELKFK